ncbi:hypothetical protein PMI33_00205, partial [Pseudomonas sp. GM67]
MNERPDGVPFTSDSGLRLQCR